MPAPLPDDDPRRTIEHKPTPDDTPGQDTDTPGNAADSTPGETPFAPPLPKLTQPNEGPPAPRSTALPTVPGFEILREIARGGMGRILAARDLTLEREVAVKVLLGGRSAAELTRRFVQESKITAQLPHPNIPPVYALGELPDGSPFLAMKLIRGRTLADELKATGVGAMSPRFVSIFEQIAQAVGFAHSVGIIHRDLKPANVMVGSFGEVQVMDWGLAKETRNAERGMRNENQESDFSSIPHSEFRTPNSHATSPGQVMGTPAFMAPEQARGEVVDARADVFSLGGILGSILTGKPPFTGTTAFDVLKLAAAGEMAGAFTRLDASGADAELIALAKRCLSPNAVERPADGGEVAKLVAAYRAGVEERLRTAERERAVAEAKAAEQRKRRRVQLALFTAVGLLLSGGGAFAWWKDRQDREQARKAEQVETSVRTGLEQGTALRKQSRFRDAEKVLTAAHKLAESDARHLLPDVEQAQADLAFAAELESIRDRKWVAMLARGRGQQVTLPNVAPDYRLAFEKRGFDPINLNPADVAERVRTSNIRQELVDALDDWAAQENDAGIAERVLAVNRVADPGPWQDALRDPRVRGSQLWVWALVLVTDPGDISPGALSALAHLAQARGLKPVALLSHAHTRFPNNFGIAFTFANMHGGSAAEQLGPLSAARALHPDHAVIWANLGAMYDRMKRDDESLVCFQKAADLDPTSATHWYNLGIVLHNRGDLPAAIDAYSNANELDPGRSAILHNLAMALKDDNDLAAAIEIENEALRLAPNSSLVRTGRGTILHATGDVKGAMAEYRLAIKLDPKYADPHMNLGVALADLGDPIAGEASIRIAVKLAEKDADVHYNLGNVLMKKGDYPAAVASFREAIRLDPRPAVYHLNLGGALLKGGDTRGATAAFDEALRRDRNSADAYFNLGLLLWEQRKLAEARTHFEEAIRLDPKQAKLHFWLADTLSQLDDHPGAIAAYREAVKLDQQYADAHHELGLQLLIIGEPLAGVASLKEAVRLMPKNATFHMSLAIGLREAGDWDGCVAPYKEAVRLRPDYVEAYRDLAGVYLFQRKFKEAAAAAREAIRLDPTFAATYVVLAQALTQLGDIVGAREAYKAGAKIDPKAGLGAMLLPRPEVLPPPREGKR